MSAAVAGFFLALADMDMTDLAAQSVASCNDLLIVYHAAADTGSQRHHHDIMAALAAALPHLTERRHISIITGADRHSI